MSLLFVRFSSALVRTHNRCIYSISTHTTLRFSSLPVESLVRPVSGIIGAYLFQVDAVTQLWENTVVRKKMKSGEQLTEAVRGRRDSSSLILCSHREPHAAHAKDYSFPASPHFSPFISLARLDSPRRAGPSAAWSRNYYWHAQPAPPPRWPHPEECGGDTLYDRKPISALTSYLFHLIRLWMALHKRWHTGSKGA